MNLGHETERIEFKKSTSELKEATVSVAAILNKHGRGELFFGVLPNGDVCGQDVAESTLRQISQTLGNSIEPRIHPTIEVLNDGEGCFYIRVAFEGAETPYACKGVYRIRVADEDVLMSQGEVIRMATDAEDRRNPWDVRLSERNVADVDEGVLRDYIERGRACGRISFEYEGIEDTLTRLKLMRDGALTNAAEVLFCESYIPMLKMGIFASHDRVEILDIQQEQGNLFELARKAEFYVLSNIRRRVEFDGRIERKEIPELPMEAVREVIINGLAHRSYRSDMAMQIEIYPDSVEVFSPGWFPDGQTPQAHLSGEDKSSNGRNKLIASTLFKSKDIESFGTGMPRIKQMCDKEGIAVSYERSSHGTIAVFHRKDPFVGSAATVNLTKKNSRPERLSGTTVAVLEFLTENPSASASEIARGLNVAARTVERALKILRDEEVIKREGSKKAGRWVVVDNVESLLSDMSE